MSSGPKLAAGFTLIEVMIVCAIVGDVAPQHKGKVVMLRCKNLTSSA